MCQATVVAGYSPRLLGQRCWSRVLRPRYDAQHRWQIVENLGVVSALLGDRLVAQLAQFAEQIAELT